MNIENIYKAVKADEMNSPLITICNELVKQGYDVKIEGVEIDTLDSETKLLEDLEKATNEYVIELIKDSITEQKFKLKFTGYHEFNFQSAN